jgi:tetratricopeptide (TPR) repeat protein
VSKRNKFSASPNLETPMERQSEGRFYHRLFSIIFFCCLGMIIYSNTLHGSFHLDDRHSIINNANIKNISNLSAIWDFWPTRFVAYLSIALNYHFHQLKVFGYHFFNLVIHLCSGVLVWWLVLLTFSAPVMKDKNVTKHKNIIAFFVAAIFLSHPIQTQAVDYIIQRATLLAAFFCLATLCLYVKARLNNSSNWKIFYLGSILTASVSMFTKEMAISLPFLICIYDFCFFRIKKGRNWKYVIPFLAIALVIPLTMLITKSVNFKEMRRAIETPPGISMGDYFLTQLRVMVTYLRLTILPLNQNLDYDYPIAKSILEIPVLSSILLLLFILFSAFKFLNKFKLAAFSVFWFFITLLPESSVIPIKDVIFEHRLYLPMVGFSIFVTSGLYYLLQKKPVKFLIMTLSCLIIAYAITAYQRNKVWKEEVTLWNDTVNKSPHKARPYNNRGYAYYAQGNFSGAIADYNKAIQINPNFADAYNNLGITKHEQGKLDQAISDYNKAIQINPNFADAYNNLGITKYAQGNLAGAIADYNKAIQINPNFADAYYDRGNAYHAQGNLAGAIADYNKAAELNPHDADIYYNRGNTYYKKGDMIQAILDYTRVIALNTNLANAYLNRALAYFAIKEYDRSWEDLYKAEWLGADINPYFLRDLKQASGREK